MGLDRKRVRYDDLTQAQFSTGLLNIISDEVNAVYKINMLKLVASLHQDMVDYGYLPVKGALAVCLTAIEDNRATWADYDYLFSLKKQYLVTSDSKSAVHAPAINSHSSTKHSYSNSSANSSQTTRVCRNYNQGRCSQSHGHVQSGVSYSHYCSFCVKQGALFPHSESTCRKRTGSNATERS